MNRFVQLSIFVTALASGASQAQEAGLCKPMCAEEKRACRTAAVKLIDREAESMTAWKEKNPAAREFGNGGVQTSQPVGPAAANAKDRKMTRIGVCEENYKICAKACSSQPAAGS